MLLEYLKQGLVFYKRAIYGLILAALVMVLLEQFTNIDLMIEEYYYNPELKTFFLEKCMVCKRVHACLREKFHYCRCRELDNFTDIGWVHYF
jgi:membrane-associated PAP2 superfamily phosphatase